MSHRPHLSPSARALFAARRQALVSRLGAETVAVIPSARMTIRNSDVEFDFRQDSTFYYLTGFEEPDSVLVLSADAGATLFVRPRDKSAETWTGRRAGVDGAVADFGVDAAFPATELNAKLPGLLEGSERVAFTFGVDADVQTAVLKAAQRHRTSPRLPIAGPDTIVDLRKFTHDLRLLKTPEELVALRRAGRVTAEGHHEVMRSAAPGVWEYELQAALEYTFKAAGAARVGYSSIVAGGQNATILHYNTNRMQLPKGGLVLVDAGAEIDYLTADVTRTFPASGHFSAEQRAVYDVVLAAEEAAIAACVPGTLYDKTHNIAVRVLVEGMVDLGLLTGQIDDLIASEAYKRYYMHRTGHWLGMDVHDVGLYSDGSASRPLVAGMVTTIEPGIYVDIDDEQAPEAFRGIGIRIEDDILVTDGEPENLTAACVKAPDEVEAMVRDAPRWVRRVNI
ncbi:MAG: aminopeptidase P N-terminal domain-containing protein [Myxococcales bacterium]|nr:aminopeptidase P N-terminal domain-containing protein [Myxococcales bacterium]